MKTGHKEILGRDMRMDAWEWTQSIQIFFTMLTLIREHPSHTKTLLNNEMDRNTASLSLQSSQS